MPGDEEGPGRDGTQQRQADDPVLPHLEEGRRVIDENRKHGLVQGENGIEIYVVCEIPSNGILAKEFSEIFNGFSIGSNDLTQLILGIDRDSEIVVPIFGERIPAVKTMIARVIADAHAAGRTVGGGGGVVGEIRRSLSVPERGIAEN